MHKTPMQLLPPSLPETGAETETNKQAQAETQMQTQPQTDAGALPPARAYSQKQLKEICSLERTLTDRRARIEFLQKATEAALMRAQRVSRLRQQIDTQRKRVGLQKQRLEDKTRHVERAAHLLEIALAQHAQAKGAIVAARRDALAVAGQVSRQAVVLRQDRIIFEDLRAMLARQRALAVGDLAEAFPVEMAMDEADWTICGLRVSSAEGVRGWQASEETAAALGLVTRLLDALARYLCVPLRFPVVPRGSRSAVCCLFSGSVEWWPLFMLRAADRPRLHTALRLLAVDIEQLLCQHGMESVDPERKRRQLSLLPNLTQLLMAIETSSFAQ